jgi:NADPH-dependent 2,4-dienoyl-CoA reductase/sulfur reductase-like enzyme
LTSPADRSAITDVLVVGAGPAGIAAARSASACGATVVVLDEYARPGGQYFRQSRLGRPIDPSVVGPSQGKGADEIAQLDPSKVRVVNDALVWGWFDDRSLAYVHEGASRTIGASAIVLATGAYERSIGFPGWTLPGVMTAGAAQTMLKEQGIRVGTRVVVAGAGPFLYPVSTQLAAAGAQLVAVCEATSDPLWLLRSRRALLQADKIREAAGYLQSALRYRLPLRFGWTVVEARGNGRVEEVVLAKLDPEWRIDWAAQRVVAADTLLINFGFIPNLQLPRLAGCAVEWDPVLSTYCTRHDEDQQTTQPGVYVAGEATGLGGHRVAMGEGHVAGMMAAASIGLVDRSVAAQRLTPVRRQLAKDRAFVDHVNRTFAIRDAIYDLLRDDVIVCRCEEVEAAAIKQVATDWDGSLRAIKQCTRAGMGPCQGRICESMVARLAARASGRAIPDLGLDPVRPAVKPLTLQSFEAAVA